MRRRIHIAPPDRRAGLEGLPGLPQARAQTHLHVQFAPETQTTLRAALKRNSCRKPVRKLISTFNSPIKLKPLSVSDAKKAGFTVLKRLGKGEYEKQ